MHPIHEFRYKDGELYCENVKLSAIVDKVGSLVYVYSHATIVDHFRKIKEAFKELDPIICFAMKSNESLSILQTLVKEGAGFDIVSGGELKKTKMVKADPKKIVFASVGKTDEEISDAIKTGILLFNVESKPELERIDLIARQLKKTAQVALRINPDIDVPTHDKINTGSLKKKFGVDLKTARALFLSRDKYKGLKINGVHIHIGSQITEGDPFVTAVKKALRFVDELAVHGIRVEYFDMGGGLGIIYHDETPQTAKQYADKIVPLFRGRDLKLLMEPGRFIVGNSGAFIATKLYLKDNGVKKFMILDAGFNDLARPSLYDAYHEILPLKRTRAKAIICDVVGPICESGDIFAKGRSLPNIADGDRVVFMSAGAYGYAMTSNYNVRCRPAEVMVKGSQWAVVKERETFKDLVRGESIPEFLK